MIPAQPIPDVIISDPTVTTGTVSDNIADRISKMDISLTMDAVSQIAFEIPDPGLKMFQANYFQIRRKVTYLDFDFEIASVEIAQGQGGEMVRVEARTAACQQLKRDKGRKTWSVGSPTALAALLAKQVGLKFFGENTAAKKKIGRVKNDTTDESSWDVLKRLAQENMFVCFEADGRLFFCTQQFLLGKFALVAEGSYPGFLATPIRWLTDPTAVTSTDVEEIVAPAKEPLLKKGSKDKEHVKFVQKVLSQRALLNVATDGVFDDSVVEAVKTFQTRNNVTITGQVDATTWPLLKALAKKQTLALPELALKTIECPQVRKSDDDVYALQMSFQVDKAEGRKLRPGMTVYLEDIPYFNGYFLIGEVRWTEGTNSTVSVSARTPQEPDSDKARAKLNKRIDYTGGGFASVNPDDIFAAD